VAVTVHNNGPGSAAASTTRIRLATSTTIQTTDPLLDTFTAGALTSGQSVTYTRTVTIPSRQTAGSYYMGATANADSALTEANGYNNQLTTPFTVSAVALVSLTLISPNGGESWTAGTTHTASWKVSGDTSQISYYSVDYSLDGGSTWTPNAAYASSSATSASWPILATTVSTHARVRIRANNSGGGLIASKSSASDFIITSTPTGSPTAVPQTLNVEPVFGATVSFIGHNSTGSSPSCGIASYLWNFGDGATSIASDPSHIYYSASSSASYTVSLKVTDSNGNTDQRTIIVRVTGQGLGSSQPQTAFSKDPVNLATGNYIYDHDDLRITGRGLLFEFKRFYNSKDTTSKGTPLGLGWTHSYNINASTDASNNVVIAYGDGHQEIYAPNGAGGYTSEPGVFNVLTANGGTFTLTTKEQQKYNFDTLGRLASITDKNADTIMLTYSGSNLAAITDTVGRVITFTSDANNRLTKITDPLGRTVQFAYDANTNLISVTDLRSNVTQFAYDGFHQITSAIDPRGNTFVSMVYDPQQRLVSLQKDALQNSTQFAYDFVNHVTTVTDAAGNQSYYYYDAQLRIIRMVDNAGHVQNYEYDTNNNRTKVVDKNGNVTSYAYDAMGNVISKTDPLGNTTTISYDTNNNPTSRRDALNGQITFQYDARGNLTKTVNAINMASTVTYDAFGQPLVLTDANGNSTTSTYDSSGNLIKIQDALGNVTSSTFDAVGRKLSQVDALGRTTQFLYDNADNLIGTVNPLGKRNSFTFDGNNNRITATDYLRNTTSSSYDAKDRLISVLDPLGGSTANTYDNLDRNIRVTDARGGVMQFGYDTVGDLTSVTTATGGVTLYSYDANGNRIGATDPLGNVTTSAYDPLNRLVSTQDALGNVTRTVYDSLGRRIQSIDALSHTKSFSYDAIGRLIRCTDVAGGTVTYGYDNVGNRISITDPNGHTTVNVFDALNHLVRTTDPVGGSTQFAYDAVGNLVSKITPASQTITYQNDSNNRCTKIVYPAGAPVTFTYDDNGNRTSMTDALGTTTYNYDALNRLTSYTDSAGMTVAYAYDANGNRKSMTYPGNKVVSYTFDAMNQLVTVTDWLNGIAANTYDAAGRLTLVQNPNGTTAHYGFDNASRLTSLINSRSDTTVISSYALTLDGVGNHLQSAQTEPLSPVISAQTIGYAYDNDNRLNNTTGAAFTYDANGNMLTKGADTFAYDYENRLTQAAVANTNYLYQYDGLGNRLRATRNGITTKYVLDVNGRMSHVLAETDAGGTIVAYYIYGRGLISRIAAGGTAAYYLYDVRGSTVALSDSTGALTDKYAYDPFGNVANGTGTSANPFKYVGRYGIMDEGNGLSYIRARYYSPGLGRFVTKDPTTGKDGDSQSLNRYIYALNNPVRLFDVSGLSAQESSRTTPRLATSDNSILHNYLISLKTAGLADQQVSIPKFAAPPTAGTSYISQAPTLSPAEQHREDLLIQGVNSYASDVTFLKSIPIGIGKQIPFVGMIVDMMDEQGRFDNYLSTYPSVDRGSVQMFLRIGTVTEEMRPLTTAYQNAVNIWNKYVPEDVQNAIGIVKEVISEGIEAAQ
jgi:RHS repeat-associated protein